MISLIIMQAADTLVNGGGTATTGLDPNVLLPTIASVLVILITYALKKWVKPLWDKLPDLAKSIIVALESVLVIFLAKAVGTALGHDIFGWDPEMWQSVLVWGMSMGWHAMTKQATTTG